MHQPVRLWFCLVAVVAFLPTPAWAQKRAMLPEDGKEGLDKRFTRDQRDAFKKLISGEETQVAGKVDSRP